MRKSLARHTFGLAGAIAIALLWTPVLADEFVWQTNTYNDPGNKGRYTAALSYAIPETDAIQFQATCAAGSSGTFASVLMGYKTGSLLERSGTTLEILLPGRRLKYSGTVHGTDSEEGLAGVLLELDYDDPLWIELADGSALRYRIKGRGTVTLSLGGSGNAVRRFISQCKTIYKASNPGSGGSNKSAKNRTCDQFGQAQSQNSNTPVTVTFVNRTGGYRSVMWIDFKGTPVNYANLDPGQSYTIKTYLTHPWMFTDGPGNCIEMFMPQRGISKFEITAASPVFGAEND